MFGLINNVANSISDTVSDFVEDPVGKAIGMATQPIRDGIEVFDGLTEGELPHVSG